MADITDLIARLQTCITMKHETALMSEAADALTAQAATIAAQARELLSLKLAADNADGMAGCMVMFRNDMIQAGVITESVAPMFMTEAILSKLSALRADAERWRYVRGGFSVMSLNIDGMHHWTWRGYHMLGRGANIDEVVDAAMSGKAVTP